METCKLYNSGVSHAATASPRPSFRAPLKMGDSVVGRGNARWTTSKSGHPCPCLNCLLWPPAEKTGNKWKSRDWTEMNWTVPIMVDLSFDLINFVLPWYYRSLHVGWILLTYEIVKSVQSEMKLSLFNYIIGGWLKPSNPTFGCCDILHFLRPILSMDTSFVNTFR